MGLVMTGRNNRIEITPQTKVGALLDAYPELEEVLIGLVPAFEKLRNPVLRRTVARVTSLQQASLVGGIDLAMLIQKLRSAVGVSGEPIDTAPEDQPGARPDWCVADNIVGSLDARPLLEAGQQPIGTVMSEIEKLAVGKVFELTAPLLPAPLIDTAKSKGFEVWWSAGDSAEFVIFFHRSRD
jgi:hypothetical protein